MFIHFFLASSLRFRIIFTTSTTLLCTPKLTPFLFKSTNPWDLAWPTLYATTTIIVLECESFVILQSWNPNWVLYHSIILSSLKSHWFLKLWFFLGLRDLVGFLIVGGSSIMALRHSRVGFKWLLDPWFLNKFNNSFEFWLINDYLGNLHWCIMDVGL